MRGGREEERKGEPLLCLITTYYLTAVGLVKCASLAARAAAPASIF